MTGIPSFITTLGMLFFLNGFTLTISDGFTKASPEGGVADLLGGRGTLPSPAEMRAEVSGAEEKMKKRYVASKRHTIQVDFQPYLRELRRELNRAAQRG